MATGEQVKELSELQNISLLEAKRKLDKLAMLQQITTANTLHDIKPVLLKIIDMLD